MPTAHSILTGLNLHHNVGDSRSLRAWTLPANTVDALLVENSNGNNLIAIETSTTPGSSVMVFGNTTDLPDMSFRAETFQVLLPLSTASAFNVLTNGGADSPLSVTTAAASGPHTVRLSEAWMRIDEVSAAPTFAAGVGFLYTLDVAGTTRLRFMRDDGSTVDLDAAASAIGGTTGATDNAVLRADGTGGATAQSSAVTIDDTGNITIGSTGNTISFSGATTFAIGGGSHGTLGGSNSLAIGQAAQTGSSDAVALGAAANVTGAAGSALGRSATAAGSSVAVGYQSSAVASSVAIGRNATSTAAGQVVFGSLSYPATALYLGDGVTSVSPDDSVITASGGSGTNVVGAAVRLAAGASTGNAAAAVVVIQTGQVGASGATAQTLRDRITVGGGAASGDSFSVWFGNGTTQATPPTNVNLLGTDASSASPGSSLTVIAGSNTSTGAAGSLTLSGGGTTGAGQGGSLSILGGISGSGTGGSITLGTGNATTTTRATVNPTGTLDLRLDHSSNLPVRMSNFTVTHTGTAAQTIASAVVASGNAAWYQAWIVWKRTTATTGYATATIFGGVRNEAGTTDEIAGATITGTIGTREGAALTDTVNCQIVADNASDEIRLQLTKSNTNDYTVHVYLLYFTG